MGNFSVLAVSWCSKIVAKYRCNDFSKNRESCVVLQRLATTQRNGTKYMNLLTYNRCKAHETHLSGGV